MTMEPEVKDLLQKMITYLQKQTEAEKPVMSAPVDPASLPRPVEVFVPNLGRKVVVSPRHDDKGNLIWVDDMNFLRPDPRLIPEAERNIGSVTGVGGSDIMTKHTMDVTIPSMIPGRVPRVIAPFEAEYENAVKMMYNGDWDAFFAGKGMDRQKAQVYYDGYFEMMRERRPAWYAVVFATGAPVNVLKDK